MSTTTTRTAPPIIDPAILAAAGNDAHYLEAALRVGVPPGQPLPVLWVAIEAGSHRTKAGEARKRLRRLGPEFWPWPDAPSGWTGRKRAHPRLKQHGSNA